jgi:hypothetical protein
MCTYGQYCVDICVPRLALAAGIYGMNFTNVETGEPSMPELKWDFGAWAWQSHKIMRGQTTYLSSVPDQNLSTFWLSRSIS